MAQSWLKRWVIGELSWRRVLRSGALLYGFFAAYVYFRADALIFLPPPPSYGESAEVFRIPVIETEAIAAQYLPQPEADWVILFIHGNAEDLGDIRPFLTDLQSWGFAVLAYDYRGYGLSDGCPGERNAYQDGLAAYNYLVEVGGYSPDQILVYGRSVGGGSALALADQVPVGGVILESTFTSAFRVVAPIPLLPFDKFPNLARIRRLSVPLLVIHGEADNTIPVSHGRRLYEAAPGPKAALWVPGADHNDVAIVAGDRLRQALQAFPPGDSD